MKGWEPLRLGDDVRRVAECWRACFADEWYRRSLARADWFALVAGLLLALECGFVVGRAIMGQG